VPSQTDILGLLSDCARLARKFYPAISAACLQLHNVIPFLPLDSRLSQVYKRQLHRGIDVNNGREPTWDSCALVLEGHTDGCNTVAFSPDGGRLVSGSDDCTIRLWNVQTGAMLQIMSNHKDIIFSAAYSHDGKLFASGSRDHSVRIWDAASGLQVGTAYTGHSQPVLCVSFSADGLLIVSGDYGGNVHVWSTDAAHRSVKVLETSR
jgi:WD40 repeat protein